MSPTTKHRSIPSPHLTSIEVAERWHCTRETVSRKWRKLGLRPIRIAGSLLFPQAQIEAVERRLMGETEDNPEAVL